MNSKHALLIAAALLFFAGGAFAGFAIHKALYPPIDPARIDTVYVSRSAEIFGPQPSDIMERPELPPVAVPAAAAQVIHDTIYLRPETHTYHEQLAPGVVATAIVTGVQPSLDYLHVTWPEASITKTVYKPYKGWMISATSDIAALASKSPQAFARAALEMSYNTGPLHVSAQAGAAFTFDGTWKPAPFIGGRLQLDIWKR